jgi:parvulin-like peptidyl-prolyl isomerase
MSRVLDVADQAAWWLRKHVRIVLPAVLGIAAVIVVIVLVSGGSDKPKIPKTASAVVGDMPISATDVAHWQKLYSAAPAGQAKPSASTARKAALAMLVQGAWISQEAARLKISVSSAKLTTAETNYFSQLGSTQTKAQVLKQLGLSEADLRFQLRISLLTTQLQDKAAKVVPAPTAAEIQQAYTAEPSRWAHPSKRDVRMVVTNSKANATAALTALKSGKTFGTVSKQYTTDATLSQNGGIVKGIVPGSTTADLETPLFAAQPNVLQGPLGTSSGWIVFQVQKSVPTSDQTLAQATPKIKKDLTATRQTKAVAKYINDVQKRWKAKTACRPDIASSAVCPKA